MFKEFGVGPYGNMWNTKNAEINYLPIAAIIPGIRVASIDALPLEYEERIICSAVMQPSAYAQPNSPTECPIIPSGTIPRALSTSVKAI